jgi:hypothetical protein
MGCENGNHTHLGRSIIRWRNLMYRDNKYLHINKAAILFACLNVVDYLRRTDPIGYLEIYVIASAVLNLD